MSSPQHGQLDMNLNLLKFGIEENNFVMFVADSGLNAVGDGDGDNAQGTSKVRNGREQLGTKFATFLRVKESTRQRKRKRKRREITAQGGTYETQVEREITTSVEVQECRHRVKEYRQHLGLNLGSKSGSLTSLRLPLLLLRPHPLTVKTDDLSSLNVGLPGAQRSRVNTWHNVQVSMQKKTKALVAQRQGTPPLEPFPSLVVTADGFRAKGSFAEAQARCLFPDESKVEELVNVLKEKKIGVVAHFCMDPEFQGILTAAQKHWPHIHISDSLVMADSAMTLAKAGCEYITVLGVDFMSENVRAVLDQAGFEKVGVYRMSNERLGCSLADAASSPSYMSYLEAASRSPHSLHVVYINTSLETKATCNCSLQTRRCRCGNASSNVVQTILQAFVQVPDANIWYGPDSYMGANIRELLQQMTKMTDEAIAEIHPEHNRDSIRSLLPRLHYFQDGTCIVHHLFGNEVVDRIKEMYRDAYLTAHFEVPGEMFSLAMEAKRRGMGVVGSTKNILDFIKQRIQEALDRNVNEQLQFVLGTESGMVTSIVAAVRSLLGSARSGGAEINVEIVFPVSSDSVTASSSSPGLNSVKLGDVILPVIPGVSSGERCSINGSCASCPYMKMNSLTSLLKVCHHLPAGTNNTLSAYEASQFKLQTPNGKSIADVGCEPILHMRHFQASKKLPEKLISQIIRPSGDGNSVLLNKVKA
ncbi:quinolinate synthase, chloroplastic-like [Pyrus x bretschneideri]|uniref:quinolinate synthase, chloroplastic-like n=1 Tax=Pyrus x bretschneideri TaxID=225117 RepID=UPI00202E1180|nr:quinolinate synthase, chloroplastic-like [Pyrus x bretschneideri]